MLTKTCGRCRKELPASPEHFPRLSAAKFGLAGTCRECRKKSRADRPPEQIEQERARLRAVYEKRKAFQQEAREARRKAHPEIFSERQRKWRARQTEEYKEEARRRAKDWYNRKREYAKARAKSRREMARREMIQAYGGKCECCGESIAKFLTLDHINGGGSLHRRSLGTSGSIWHTLKRLGWPKEGYRLLCYNCNCARAHNGGVCPHEEIAASSKRDA